MTAKVKIVTDSTGYLGQDSIEKYDIRVVPLRVIFGSEVFAEGVDITNEEFYQRLDKSRAHPTTAQPPVSDFTKVYGELAQLGHPILSIHISSKLSGTMNSALAARAAFPQAQIEVVDWLSMGMGVLVLVAARAAEEGKDLAEIKAIMERLIARINVVGTIDTLKYLYVGGRFAIMAFVGNLLSIKPVLAMRNHEVKLIARTRSRNKAIKYMLGLIEQRADKNAPLHGAVVHSRALEEALALEKEIRTRYNCEELYLVELGPVFAAHTGPGTLGLVFYSGEG